MKKLLITTTLAVCLSTSAHAFLGGDTVNNTTNNKPTAIAGAAAGAKAYNSVDSKNIVKATGGDSYARTGDSKASIVDNAKTTQASLQGQLNSQQGGDVSIGGDVFEAPEIPVNSAIAFAPIPTSDCLGSVGAAGQGSLFGGALSFTTQSRPCNIREYSKLATAYAGKKYGRLVLCQDEIIRKSFKGTPMACPVTETPSEWRHGRIEGSGNRR